MFGFEIFIGAIKRLLFFLPAANIDAPFCERNKPDVYFWIWAFALRGGTRGTGWHAHTPSSTYLVNH